MCQWPQNIVNMVSYESSSVSLMLWLNWQKLIFNAFDAQVICVQNVSLIVFWRLQTDFSLSMGRARTHCKRSHRSHYYILPIIWLKNWSHQDTWEQKILIHVELQNRAPENQYYVHAATPWKLKFNRINRQHRCKLVWCLHLWTCARFHALITSSFDIFPNIVIRARAF